LNRTGAPAGFSHPKVELMLSIEDNEVLCNLAPGTPMGEASLQDSGVQLGRAAWPDSRQRA